MSNADDRCAYVDSDGQCKYLRGNHWYVDGWHAFVETAPQPAPSAPHAGQRCERGHPIEACDPCWTQPAPSGDEAKVRDIASEDDVLFKIAKEWTSGDYGRMVSAVREAYAAGKADGARENKATIDRLQDKIDRLKEQVADAIRALRGRT